MMRKQPLSPNRAFSGQGGLIAASVTILIALVIMGTSLSGLSQLNATHSVVTKQSLQTYYAAQAGLQEALATRMLPRSNYYNFDNTTDSASQGRPVSDKRYFGRSGNIYQNPANTKQGLIAKYRYLILGGDAARQSNGNYYNNQMTQSGDVSRLLSTDSIPPDSPFIVVSNGITCKSATGSSAALADRFTTGTNPGCSQGSVKDEITIVATVRLGQEQSAAGVRPMDQVVGQRIYKNSSSIPLPVGAFVPGTGWRNANQTFDFYNAWTTQSMAGEPGDPLRLMKVVFYSFADNAIHRNCDINGNQTVNCGQVPADTALAIRLYFNGPIDYRSISPRADLSDRELKDCKPTGSSPNQPDNCHIRVVKNPPMSGSNHAYTSNTTIPLFPGSTQVILLPPLDAITPNQPHQIEVDTTRMRSFSNRPGLKNYRVRFTTN